MRLILSYIIIFLNFIFIIALISSLISQYIDPNIFWQISFIALFFPVYVICNILTTIYFGFNNKTIMWINICLILVSIPKISEYISFISEDAKGPAVSVMSYNVRLFNKLNWIKDEEINKKIVNFINSKNMDIVCIQEYYRLPKNLKFKFKYQHIGEQRRSSQWHMAILSNYQIINKGTVEINGRKMNNTCIYSDIKINEDTIRVYNIHLASNSLSETESHLIESPHYENKIFDIGIIGVINRLKRSFENRGKEVKQIKYHIENSKYKTISCGDLNDTPISYAYAEISEDKYDAFKKSGIGLGSTYFNIPSLRIDYIFYDKTFKSRNFTVYQEKFSDHKAIEIGKISKIDSKILTLK